MEIRTDYIFKFLQILAYIIFIGLCFEAGGFLVNTIQTLFFNPEGTTKFWYLVDLSALYQFNESYYVSVATIMVIVATLKALMFYLIVRIFHNKAVNFTEPFNEAIQRTIANIGYIALGIGLFSGWGGEIVHGVVEQGVKMPDLQFLKLGGADVWFFMGITLLIFARIFKKGIDLQNENNLTV